MDTEHYRHKDEMASKTILWHASEETHGRHETGKPAATSIKVLLKGKCRLQWLMGRASDSRLRGPGFESCAAVLKPWASFFTLHSSSSHSCITEYLDIDSGRYVYEQPSCALSVAYGWMLPREVEMVSD